MEWLDLSRTLTRATVEVSSQPTPRKTLQAIVDVARTTLDEIDHAGITVLHRDQRLETAAATDDLVTVLDALQYEAGEGPCLSALDPDEPAVIVVENAPHSGRWHRFIPRAAAHGLRAQLGVRLFALDETIGVLNLYSTTSESISQETRHLAELFATHAAVAYGQVRKLDNLQTALATRETIGQAVGIVMERYHLSPDRAFDYLARVSSSSQTKLRDVAQQVVDASTADDDSRAGRGG